MVQGYLKVKPITRSDTTTDAKALIGDLMRLDGALQMPHGRLIGPSGAKR